MKFQTINPTTEEVVKEYETYDEKRIYEIAENVKKGFEEWRNFKISERARYMKMVADVLRKRKSEFAELITTEMGKPITQSYSEIEKCTWTAEIYADNSEKWLEDEILNADGKNHIVRFEPLGVILSIMPWNFPFWQVFRFGIPTLMAGNTTILKHSNVVTGCALAIEDAFKEIGIENVFKTIIAEHKITNDLIGSDYISGVSLTGSVSAGQKIAEGAGKNLKKFVLELGGSDPFIVFEDADLELASKIGVQARNINTGQSCIAAKRFIIVKEVAEEFTKRFVEHTKNLLVGDPFNEHTQVGPLVRDEQRLQLELQLEDSVNSGAKILTGGNRLPRKGFFFEPTVVGDVTPDMRVANEEVFGPISPIIVVNDVEEALRVANNSEFGLGASIWTKNTEKALEIGRRLEAGCVFINSLVKSDPRLPFGGIKKSGIGRELSEYGLKEFVNVKAISVY